MESKFTKYQVFLVIILTITQFTLILDFMVLSPLGAILMKELSISPSKFGFVVSAYAFSAGLSGLLAAGFADKYDRKKLYLFFYCGFIIGTFLCAMATSYNYLLAARIITGIFGGVIGSIGFAIISDLFKLEFRGRVMGFVQMAFSASQILGLPLGLFLANKFGWHSPFWLIACFSIVVAIVILVFMKPVNEHLKIKNENNAFKHLWQTITNNDYLRGFSATVLLSTGGFMLMPFGSAYSINNLKVTMEDLPIIYGVTGLFTIFTGPLSGKFSDKFGSFKIFLIGSALSLLMVLVYTNLGPSPVWLIIIVNILLFTGITGRMIAASTLISALPQPKDRGSFMSVNSSIQQISGGLAASLAGFIVTQDQSGKLQNYTFLGVVVSVSFILAGILMLRLDNQLKSKI